MKSFHRNSEWLHDSFDQLYFSFSFALRVLKEIQTTIKKFHFAVFTNSGKFWLFRNLYELTHLRKDTSNLLLYFLHSLQHQNDLRSA